MTDLITFDEAINHLREIGTDDDADIYSKISQASDIVRDYCTTSDKATWTATTVPQVVKGAVMIVFGELFENREANSDPLSDSVKRLLRRHRTPALA